MELLTNTQLNGLLSFIFRIIADVIFVCVVFRQIIQFKHRRLLWLKLSMLFIVTVTIFSSIPAIAAQFFKVHNQMIPMYFANLASITNAFAQFCAAIAFLLIYYKNSKEK